jgi:hypothetical protein
MTSTNLQCGDKIHTGSTIVLLLYTVTLEGDGADENKIGYPGDDPLEILYRFVTLGGYTYIWSSRSMKRSRSFVSLLGRQCWWGNGFRTGKAYVALSMMKVVGLKIDYKAMMGRGSRSEGVQAGTVGAAV